MLLIGYPLRVSFLGGGTDLPSWFSEKGGAVISTAINKKVYVAVSRLSPIWQTKYKFSYSATEDVSSIAEIKHPLIRACVECHAEPGDRLSIVYMSDLPGNSGLGSSSAFCNAMVQGIRLIADKLPLSNRELAKASIHLERDILQEAGGWQDQISSAYGGFNHIEFDKRDFKVNPLKENFITEYLSECFLIHVGSLRKAHEIAVHQTAEIANQQSRYQEMASLVEEGLSAVNSQSLNDFSDCIDMSWEIKKQFSQSISNSPIDELVKHLRSIGGRGIKLLGAGSGGFVLVRFHGGLARLNQGLSNKHHIIKVEPQSNATLPISLS